MKSLDVGQWLNFPAWLFGAPPEASSPRPILEAAPGRARRIMLYSHDTQGLGHMRRNLSIAKALMKSEPPPAILLIGGAREMGALDMPAGIDCLTLPALGKRSDGQYQARSLSVSLELLITLRANTICAAVQAFQPDVFIVDKVARGAFNELEPSLKWLREHGQTHCVLGLREVLDAPATVRREWQRSASETAIRDYYDTIWVYGDPAVYDPVREYGFSPAVAAKIRYTGYLDRRDGTDLSEHRLAELQAELDLPAGKLALCLVGGGQDGFELAEAFARAELPEETNGVIVTGPFMPREARRRLDLLVLNRPHMRILTFVKETAALLHVADHVVAMGGYNTVCEVLAFEKRALIVPRIRPRREQIIRAERLHALGALDMLHPDHLTPAAVTSWLAKTSSGHTGLGARIDLNGLGRIQMFVNDLYGPVPQHEAIYAA